MQSVFRIDGEAVVSRNAEGAEVLTGVQRCFKQQNIVYAQPLPLVFDEYGGCMVEV